MNIFIILFSLVFIVFIIAGIYRNDKYSRRSTRCNICLGGINERCVLDKHGEEQMHLIYANHREYWFDTGDAAEYVYFGGLFNRK